jgi:hypothetical protein
MICAIMEMLKIVLKPECLTYEWVKTTMKIALINNKPMETFGSLHATSSQLMHSIYTVFKCHTGSGISYCEAG